MQIQSFASGSGGNCYRVTAGGSSLLLDAGIRFREIRKALNFQVSSLAGVLVSHEHADHSKAAKDLARAGVDVYLSRGTSAALDLIGHRVEYLTPLQQTEIGAWTVLPFSVMHDAEEPLGFLLATGGEKLLYLTDSAYCPYRFQGLTHILLEINYSTDILNANVRNGTVSPDLRNRIVRSHMSLETAKGFLGANDISRVEEIHLMHLSGGNSDAGRFKREIQRLTGRPTFVCEEGLR